MIIVRTVEELRKLEDECGETLVQSPEQFFASGNVEVYRTIPEIEVGNLSEQERVKLISLLGSGKSFALRFVISSIVYCHGCSAMNLTPHSGQVGDTSPSALWYGH